ncbi:hypothetical protein N657DRAFT_680494 [Parathielavia appendiculata]|uniref:Uncharacterized protein n=1 Tax=Parathielavia appendiculata TaxID=2587402 RepID=A0AAN6Z4C6_9PEZI|nr:hypothetical protein N657DRAFT_680494 [Parathielavia appendiculata]
MPLLGMLIDNNNNNNLTPVAPHQTGLQPRKNCFKPFGSGEHGTTAPVTFSAEARDVITWVIVKTHSRDRVQWEAETKDERRRRCKQNAIDEYWECESEFIEIINVTDPDDARFEVEMINVTDPDDGRFEVCPMERQKRELRTEHNTELNMMGWWFPS